MASKYDEPDAGYHLYVIPSDLNERPYYIPLESDGSGYQIFAIGVQLKKYDAVKIYDANTYTLWGEDNIEPYGAYREFVADPDYGMVCWVEEGQYDIYVKLSSGNDSIYVGWTGAEAPVNVNYQLCVTPQSGEKYYINLTPYDEFDGFAQHRALNVHFQAGDLITLYDVKNNAHWAEDTLDQYGEYRKFTSLPGQGIRCDQEGYYDVYVKFKYEQDQIYIGPGTNG